jgi:RNA polymerase sigma factor (sigma-70 family)
MAPFDYSADLTKEQEGLVLDNLGYAEQIARAVSRTLPLVDVGMSVDDCVQLGLLGLVQAAKRFDASDHDPRIATVNTRFKSYAYLRIRGAVIDECRRLGPNSRNRDVGLGRTPVFSLDYEGGENLGWDEFIDESREDWIDFRRAFGTLAAGDQRIAVQIMSGVPYTELAPTLGVSEQKMYQIAKRIRVHLSSSMAGENSRPSAA